MREPIRRITAMLLTFSVWYLAIADGVLEGAENSSQKSTQAGMIYMTPEECPRSVDFSIFKRCGFDKSGVQAPIVLDKEGNLPKDSSYKGIYGR